MRSKRYINETVIDIIGSYSNGKITVDGKIYPIYFKNRMKRPENGSNIRIKRAQIGYYKNHNELVIWDRDDYIVLE